MVTQQRIAEELKAEREALTAYLKDLPEAAWDKQSLCEGWSVKDLMAHVVGVASDVANRRLDGVGTPEANQKHVDDRKDHTPQQILDEWETEGALLEEGVLALDDEFWTAPYTDNFNVGQSLQRMVEDIWVHSQDIRLGLAQEAKSGPGLVSTLEVGSRDLHNRLPLYAASVGKITINAGEFASEVQGPGNTNVTITGDPITLALVSTGRIKLDDAVRDSKLQVEPDAPTGLAQAINIYAA